MKKLLTSILLGVALLGAAYADSFDKVYSDWQVEYSKLNKAGSIKSAEDMYKSMDAFVGRIDYKEVTPEVMEKMADSPFSGHPAVAKSSADWLKTYKAKNNNEKLWVKTMNTYLALVEFDAEKGDKKKMSGLVGGVFKDKSLSGLATKSMGARLATVLQYTEYNGVSNAQNYDKFFAAIKSGCHTSVMSEVLGMWSDYAKAYSTSKNFKTNWEIVHMCVNDEISKVPATEKQKLAMLNRGKSELESKAGRGMLVGYEAPQIDFEWVSDASAVKLSDYKGKIVVLDFWATWCGPCITSMPKIRELQAHYKGKPVVIIGVTSIQGMHVENGKRIDLAEKPQEEMDMMKSYIKNQDVTWTIAYSKQEVFNPDYGVNGIPHMAIIDAKGVLRYSGIHPGATPTADKIKMIDGLLKEAGLLK